MASLFGGQGNNAVYCAGGCGKKTRRKTEGAPGYRDGTPLCLPCAKEQEVA